MNIQHHKFLEKKDISTFKPHEIVIVLNKDTTKHFKSKMFYYYFIYNSLKPYRMNDEWVRLSLEYPIITIRFSEQLKCMMFNGFVSDY